MYYCSITTTPCPELALHTNAVSRQTVGAAVLFVLGGVTLAESSDRRRVFALLVLGAGSHLFTEGLLRTPTGHSFAVFWPLSRYHPPTPGLSLSTDPWVPVLAGAGSVVVWVGHRVPWSSEV